MKSVFAILKNTVICLLTVSYILAGTTLVAGATEDTTAEVITSANVALIELESYEITEGSVKADKDVIVTLKLHNVNSSASATNVILTVSSNSGMVYPSYGGDNQIYVGNISAGGTKEVEVPLTISSSYNSGVIDLVCNYAYTSSSRQLSNTSTIVLSSQMNNSLELKKLGVSKSATVNAYSLLSISLVNNSSYDVTDAFLTVEGNVSDTTKTIALDTIYSGKTLTDDCMISFTESGDQSISISLTYTDSEGDQVTNFLGSYTVSVEEETVSAVDSDSADNTALVWGGRAIAAVFILIACAAVVLYVKKR